MREKDDDTGKEIERRSDSFLRDILDNIDKYAFGIITQHGYRELEKKLDDHAALIEGKFHRWFVRALVAGAIMGLGVALGLAGYGVLLSRQGDLLDQFKETRKAFVFDSCNAQNKRHDETLAKLDKAKQDALLRARTHRERAQIEQSTKVSIGLIEALQPKQNCVKLAAVSVGDAKPPPPTLPTVHEEGGR